jgi:phosphate transport system substrate-binding protein
MRAASFWNGNPASSDEYDRSIADGLDSGVLGFAGHFGRRHGFDPSGERHRPPFRVAVGNTDAEDALDALVEGTADLAELGTGRAERDQVIAEQVAEHHLFRAGSVLAASRDVSARGVESLAREELVGIYDGRVTNWAALGGPDREIRLVERVERTFLEGAGGGIDEIYGRPERLRGAVRERDDVLTRVFPRDVGEFREGGGSEYRILELERDGQRRGPGDRGYPSTVPLPLFTRGDPDGRERAFLDALSTDPVHPWILDHEDAPLRIFPAADPPDY